MKIDKEGFFELTYCTNIHPGESWKDVFSNLKTFVPKIKTRLTSSKAYGIGLRLSEQAAVELLQGARIKEFKAWLAENGCYVMTINGFPYGNFHNTCVKEQVYAPDWSTKERRDYSLHLTKILSELTPDHHESGFSTSPLTYKAWVNTNKSEAEILHQSSIFICDVIADMARIYAESDKFIHIDIEPEPDCLIETIPEAIKFFQKSLIPIGVPYLAKQMKISHEQAEEYIFRHAQLCYDVCHSNVEYEDPAFVYKSLAESNIKIGKIQLSAALKCHVAHDKQSIKKLQQYLSQFQDPVYLHQVIAHYEDGHYEHFKDLNLAIKQMDAKELDEMRIHYHVPLFLDHYQMLESTQNQLRTALKLLKNNKATHQLEIETYTFDVLPKEMKLDIISSIEREYKWVLDQFESA
jgi:hypothetical protein